MRFVAACEIDLISWIFNDKEKENLTTYKIGLRAGWCSIHCIGIFWIRIWTVLNFFFLVLIELTCFVWLRGKFCANVENVVEMYHNITDIKMTFYFFQLQDEKHKNGADAVRELWIYGMKIVANLV